MGGGAGDANAVDVTYEGTIVAAKDLKPVDTNNTQGQLSLKQSNATSQTIARASETSKSQSEEEKSTEEENKARKLLNKGSGAYGIVAQSIGGSGGDGGLNVSGGIQFAQGKESTAAGLVVGVGGFGGKGGNANNVDLTVNGSGNIEAYGIGKSAVSALSLGGSGGNGGLNVTGGITSDTAILVGVGGDGGTSGFSKDVKANINSNLIINNLVTEVSKADQTKPFASAGLLAQSIGGGGGNGGLNVTGGITFGGQLNKKANSLSLGIGGSGGTGNTSGNVDVTMVGTIDAKGENVKGLGAQSIGGGGGNGALNVTGQVSRGSGDDVGIAIGVGGNGGTGAQSGNVSVNQSGAISTTGSFSTGLNAQSIGGGGGNGGANITGMVAYGVNPVIVGVGGSGGSGAKAGSVTVKRGDSSTDAGSISTIGRRSSAIAASSIGGGGGNAGINIAAAGAIGLEKQGMQATIAVGGNGGTGSDGDKVTVDNHGNLITQGEHSYGLLAQSIGGGGGNGNYNLGVNVVYGNKAKPLNENTTANVNIGGQPGSAGNGDDVQVTHNGDVQTNEDKSLGLLAQSIGGGGGNVGFGLTVGFAYENSKKDNSIDFTLGRQGGTGGVGGNVTVNSKGSVSTKGDDAMGIMAQSLGGGGGISSSTTFSASENPNPDDASQTESLKVSVGAPGGTGAKAGDVTLTAEGSVTQRVKNLLELLLNLLGEEEVRPVLQALLDIKMSQLPSVYLWVVLVVPAEPVEMSLSSAVQLLKPKQTIQLVSLRNRLVGEVE